MAESLNHLPTQFHLMDANHVNNPPNQASLAYWPLLAMDSAEFPLKGTIRPTKIFLKIVMLSSPETL